ncbi:MAG TPA: M28 family peptidase [Verrucomicrobiales bacterium]|nr:M28 family peptidase [Verrucomicrobiales bacterium]
MPSSLLPHLAQWNQHGARFVSALSVLTASLLALHGAEPGSSVPASESRFLSGARQLTFEGRRAGEGYFSADGRKLIFQSERDPGNPFFQIFILDLDTGDSRRVSLGKGKTTCAWFHPSGDRVLFASTHEDPEAEEKQRVELEERASGRQRRYSWDYDEHYDIFEASPDGSQIRNLTTTKGYDAEGAYSPDGKSIVFASNREAYLRPLSPNDRQRFETDPAYFIDLYLMRSDGSDLRRLTNAPGYDGGPFFSADGRRICWRRFNEDGDKAEIWTMSADGTGHRQVTTLNALSWAPFFHPSGDYLIFATNLHGFDNFELYLVDVLGRRDPLRVTHTPGFDGLPAFSPDGKQLTWTSNRTSDTTSQIYLAGWNHNAARNALGLNRPDVVPATVIGTQPAPGFESTNDAITEEDLRQHLTWLASEQTQGRLTGTEGERLATEYVAGVFRGIGLETAGDDGSFFQNFEFTAGVALGDSNALQTHRGEQSQGFEVQRDWLPLAFSETGTIEPAGIVFAGYGLDIPEQEGEGGKPQEAYTSYAHLDVADQWALVFRYMPEDIPSETRQRFARYSSLRYKAMVARDKGARGLIVVSGPASKVKSELVPLQFDASLATSGIPAVSINDRFAAELLGPGKNLAELQKTLDSGQLMQGFPLPGVTLSAHIDIQAERRSGRNVIARLPGPETAGSAPAVAVGAHVDHLGDQAGSNSRATGEDAATIHFGADDNASGVAALLEIAQFLAAEKREGRFQPQRDLLFAAWSGEELGLLGSTHFALKIAESLGGPESPIDSRIGAYLNMDMIGRLDRSLVLQGLSSGDGWRRLIERCNVVVGIPLVLQGDPYAPTDSTAFYPRGVPVLNAFTGSHEEYHTPRDTVDLINFPGTHKVARFMSLMAQKLAESETGPVYRRVGREQNPGPRAHLRAYLGTVPNYAQKDGLAGVELSGVAAGGPADEAGVRAGDIIVGLAGRQVANIYDYTYAIEALKIGDAADIVVKRGEEELKLTIFPGSRE